MKKFIMMIAVLVSVFSLGILAQAAPKSDIAASGADLLDELIAIGKLAEEESSVEIEELIAFIKAKLETGDLTTDQDIQDAIKEGEEKFQVTLTEEEKQKILDIMHKIKELGLDPEKLLDQAKGLYTKFSDELIEDAEEAVKQSVKDSVSDFFTDFSNRIKGFVLNIFHK